MTLIDRCVNKLFKTLPDNLKKIESPIEIDLVLEGGAFNGSYLIGVLYFLKKMEKNNIIKIKRISGSSIGSLVGLLYFIGDLEFAGNLYNILLSDFMKNNFLNITHIIQSHLKDKIPKDVCSKLYNKLFISYTNIETKKKIVMSKYKNIDCLLDSIIKSCFIPFMIDGNICYKNKFFDGILPYVFLPKNNRKILYVDIMFNEKSYYILNAKNEKSNLNRILTGMLDVHFFFIKQHKTNFCSYVNDWTCFDIFKNVCKQIIEKLVIYIIYFILFFKKLFSPKSEIVKNVIYKHTSNYLFNLYSESIKHFCF
jgi:hypothetical protein